MCGWLEKQKWIEDSALFPHKQRAEMLRELLEEHEINPKEKYIISVPPYMRRFDMSRIYTQEEMVDMFDYHKDDTVKHPDYYNWHPVAECIDIIAEFPWCRGEAIKYIWRAGKKDPNREVEDLKKAIECLQAEVQRLKNE